MLVRGEDEGCVLCDRLSLSQAQRGQLSFRLLRNSAPQAPHSTNAPTRYAAALILTASFTPSRIILHRGTAAQSLRASILSTAERRTSQPTALDSDLQHGTMHNSQRTDRARECDRVECRPACCGCSVGPSHIIAARSASDDRASSPLLSDGSCSRVRCRP
jgi:hypothetical protein